MTLLITWFKKRDRERWGDGDYLVSKDLLRSSVSHLYYCPAPAQLRLLKAFQSDNLPCEYQQLCGIFFKQVLSQQFLENNIYIFFLPGFPEFA